MISLATILKENKELERAGGATYLAQIIDFAPMSLNPKGHAQIIAECALRREIVTETIRLLDDASSGANIENLRAKSDKIQECLNSNQFQKTKSRFQLKQLSEIEFRSPDWIIRSLLEKDSLNMVFSDPGGGKTFLVIDMACSVATDKDFHGMKVNHGPVVYIAGEGQSGIKRRFMAWGIRHMYDLEDTPIFVSLMPGGLCDQKQAGLIVDAVKQIAEEYGEPALIVIDTVARNFGPGDENSTKDMSGFIKGVDLIREQCHSCILLVHHSGHGDKSRGRGSMALKGALDSEYRLEKDDQGTIRMENTKMKDFMPPAPMAFKLATVDLPFKDEAGNSITSAVLNCTSYEQIPSQGKKSRGKWQIKALQILKTLYQEHRETLEAGGYDIEQAKVTLDDWRLACLDAEAPRQTFHRLKKSLQESHEIKIEGSYVYL